MRKIIVTYNPSTHELRNDPNAFAERQDAVDAIVWQKGVGERVGPGDLLAEIQWAGRPIESVLAPDNCRGKIRDINNDLMYEDLIYPPSQCLAVID